MHDFAIVMGMRLITVQVQVHTATVRMQALFVIPLTLQINGIAVPPLAQQDYYREYLSKCKFGICLATATTLGRVAGDCAAVGIPCIGTPNLYQQSLFPDLTIQWSDPRQIMNLIDKLMDDYSAGFYTDVVNYAMDAVKDYSVENVAKKLMQLYEEYKQ